MLNHENALQIGEIETTRSELAAHRDSFRAHAAAAIERQEDLNAASQEVQHATRGVDGVGQLKYRIDPDLYWHMRNLFGPDCWKETSFTDHLEGLGVIQRVRYMTDRMVSLGNFDADGRTRSAARQAVDDWENKKRFTKTYTFSDSELGAPSTSGVVDGTEA
jgi:hypothetical protein